MHITTGTRIGSYEVVDSLGAGGMGNVYRASDPRLGREIAIKTLPPELAHDEAALARFEREARFLAALNHPNIASIYGIEEHDGERFLILELVPGETLDKVLANGPLSVERTVSFALDIEDSRGAWSPDGQSIAFNSDRAGDMNIWTYSFRDGATHQITKGAGGDFQPNWSPDMRDIVFFSSRSGNADIWKVDVASGKLTQLTREPSLEINPFFSPDGKDIAYQSDVSGRLELWVMRSDGSQRRKRTDVGAAGHFMRWQRDGFIYFRSPTTRQTMRVSPLAGDPQPVSENGGAHISFSPDGTKMIDVSGHKVLWLYTLADGGKQQLFTFEDPDVRIDYPVWSPDGRWLLFDRFKPEGGDIWMAEGIE